MPKEDLIQNFRISVKIEQFLGFDQKPQYIFYHGKYAKGIKELRSAYAKCFNETEEFIRKDLEDKK